MAVLAPALHLVEANERSDADVIFLQKVDARLSSCDGVDDDVIQSGTRRRDSHVILLIYRTKVTLAKKACTITKQ